MIVAKELLPKNFSELTIAEKISYLLEVCLIYDYHQLTQLRLKELFPELDQVVDISTSVDFEGSPVVHEINAAMMIELHLKQIIVLLKKSNIS